MAIAYYEPANTVDPGNDPSKPYIIVAHRVPSGTDSYDRFVFLTVPNWDTAKLVANALNATLSPAGPVYT